LGDHRGNILLLIDLAFGLKIAHGETAVDDKFRVAQQFHQRLGTAIKIKLQHLPCPGPAAHFHPLYLPSAGIGQHEFSTRTGI
jgi:hypothetical protein